LIAFARLQGRKVSKVFLKGP